MNIIFLVVVKLVQGIHVVTHSHLDAGWYYDVERCYGVAATVLDSVIPALLEDK
jgi:hypothetical protein